MNIYKTFKSNNDKENIKNNLILNNLNKKFSFRINVHLIILGFIWFCFPPIYLKTDDVIMSMISGGYGQMHEKSSFVYFNSTIFGFISSSLPNIIGVTPYNYLNLILLITCFVCLGETLYKITKRFVSTMAVNISISIFVLVRPTFTTITGYLCINALLNIYLYSRSKIEKYLVYGFIFILVATLFRDEMVAFFILFTAIIFLKPFLENRKKLLLYITISIVLYGVIQLVNIVPYNDSNLFNWSKFIQLISPINNFGADQFILKYDKILLENNYSSNDIKLIRNWFFLDPHLSDTARLEKLITEVGWRGSVYNFNFMEALSSTQELLFNYPLNYILFSALILMLFVKKAQDLRILWFLMFLSIISGALIGRQLSYVYYPIIAFLFVLTYINLDYSKKFTKMLPIIASVVILTSTIYYNFSNKSNIENASKQFNRINLDKLWVIGGGLPTDLIFPLLSRPIQQTALITSDWSIYALKSNFVKYNSNNNFISELQSKQGVNVSTNIYHIPLIQIYCKEKFGSDLVIKPVIDDNLIKINNLRCLSNQPRIVAPNMEFDKLGEGFIWITSDQLEFDILNYSNKHFNGSYNLVSQNNPCKKNISYTLSSSMFSISTSTQQKNIFIPLSLQPYEKILIRISIPSGQEFCKISGDQRSLITMFKNFTQ
jgi:hypothetical protein